MEFDWLVEPAVDDGPPAADDVVPAPLAAGEPEADGTTLLAAPEVALDPDGTLTFGALGVVEPTFGVVTDGVLTEGVETVDPGTVTEGTVVAGTVPDGTDTVGRPAAATGIVKPNCIPNKTGTTTIPRLKIRRTITVELPEHAEPTQNYAQAPVTAGYWKISVVQSPPGRWISCGRAPSACSWKSTKKSSSSAWGGGWGSTCCRRPGKRSNSKASTALSRRGACLRA